MMLNYTHGDHAFGQASRSLLVHGHAAGLLPQPSPGPSQFLTCGMKHHLFPDGEAETDQQANQFPVGFYDPDAPASVPSMARIARNLFCGATAESLAGLLNEKAVFLLSAWFALIGVAMDTLQWSMFPLFALAPRKLRVKPQPVFHTHSMHALPNADLTSSFSPYSGN